MSHLLIVIVIDRFRCSIHAFVYGCMQYALQTQGCIHKLWLDVLTWSSSPCWHPYCVLKHKGMWHQQHEDHLLLGWWARLVFWAITSLLCWITHWEASELNFGCCRCVLSSQSAFSNSMRPPSDMNMPTEALSSGSLDAKSVLMKFCKEKWDLK